MNTPLPLEDLILSHFVRAKVLGERMHSIGILDPIGMIKVSSHLCLAHVLMSSEPLSALMPKSPKSAVLREVSARCDSMMAHASFLKILHGNTHGLPTAFSDALLPHFFRAMDSVLNFWESDSKRIAEGRESVGEVLDTSDEFVAAIAPASVSRQVRFIHRLPQILALATISGIPDDHESYTSVERVLQAEALKFAHAAVGATHLAVLSAFDALVAAIHEAEVAEAEQSRRN